MKTMVVAWPPKYQGKARIFSAVVSDWLCVIKLDGVNLRQLW